MMLPRDRWGLKKFVAAKRETLGYLRKQIALHKQTLNAGTVRDLIDAFVFESHRRPSAKPDAAVFSGGPCHSTPTTLVTRAVSRRRHAQTLSFLHTLFLSHSAHELFRSLIPKRKHTKTK